MLQITISASNAYPVFVMAHDLAEQRSDTLRWRGCVVGHDDVLGVDGHWNGNLIVDWPAGQDVASKENLLVSEFVTTLSSRVAQLRLQGSGGKARKRRTFIASMAALLTMAQIRNKVVAWDYGETIAAVDGPVPLIVPGVDFSALSSIEFPGPKFPFKAIFPNGFGF